jgi:hypothetical protein
LGEDRTHAPGHERVILDDENLLIQGSPEMTWHRR